MKEVKRTKEEKTRRSLISKNSRQNELSNDRTPEHVHLRQQGLSKSELGRIDVVDGLSSNAKQRTKVSLEVS